MNHEDLMQQVYDSQKELIAKKVEFEQRMYEIKIEEVKLQLISTMVLARMNAASQLFIHELENYDYKQTRFYKDHQKEMMRLERKRLLIIACTWLGLALVWAVLYIVWLYMRNPT
jgi:hypothetical protein